MPIRWTGQMPGGTLPGRKREDWAKIPYRDSGTFDPDLVKWSFLIHVRNHAISADGSVAATASDGEIFVQPSFHKDLARNLKANAMLRPGFSMSEEAERC